MANSNLIPMFQQFEYMASPFKLKGKLNFARSLSRLRANESEYEPCLPTDEARKKMKWTKLEQNSPSVSNEFTNQLSKKFNPTIFKDESQFLNFLTGVLELKADEFALMATYFFDLY